MDVDVEVDVVEVDVGTDRYFGCLSEFQGQFRSCFMVLTLIILE